MALPTLTLRAGSVQPVWLGHPWVYQQAIATLDGSPAAGDEVEVRDARGNRLGRGFYSPNSAIPVRLATRDADENLDQAWLARRLERAVARRAAHGLPNPDTTAFRLVHAEGDGLPGLIVDRYGDVAVVQLSTAGMARRADLIARTLVDVAGVTTVVVAEAGEATKREAIEVPAGTLLGPVTTHILVRELGFVWSIPVGPGQKTGFYVDQRPNRARVEALAAGRRVLDLCCYVGGFALAAARGGASEVVAVDSSEPSLELARSAAATNGRVVDWRKGDIRKVMEALAADGESFDLIVLDPPKLARGAREVDKALGRYTELNRLALALLSERGTLVSCSCSGAVGPERFVRAIARAGAEIGRATTLLDLGGAGPDHPSPPAFPEGRYLTVATVERL